MGARPGTGLGLTSVSCKLRLTASIDGGMFRILLRLTEEVDLLSIHEVQLIFKPAEGSHAYIR